MSEVKVDLDKPVLRNRQVRELQAELDRLQAQDRDPDRGASFRSGTSGYDTRIGRRNARQVKQMLSTQAPDPKPDDETKDTLRREEHHLREKIRDGMPTQYEMRANPPGTVAKHMRWEKGLKKDIMRWKHARIRLEPDNDDQDLANVELLRHPGHRWVPTDAYRESFDRVEWGRVASEKPYGLDAPPPNPAKLGPKLGAPPDSIQTQIEDVKEQVEKTGIAYSHQCECGKGWEHRGRFLMHQRHCKVHRGQTFGTPVPVGG